MFIDAREASRTLRLLVAVIGLLTLAGLSFALLPRPYADYVPLALVLLAGFFWTYLSFQIRIGRTERSARAVDKELFHRRAITEAALLIGTDDSGLLSRRRLLLQLLAASSLLAVVRLVFRAMS